MAWKGVHICEPAGLSLHQCQLVVEQGEASTRIPVEDIAFVILDTQQTRLTGALFTALMENGVILLQCDDRHLPCGLSLPVSSHWRQGEILELQIKSSAPFRKRCWQAIVRQKIENQAHVLDLVAPLGVHKTAHALRGLIEQVHSGDPRNIEAQAARAYWPALFADFRRMDEGDLRNSALNYGYAVVRAVLARMLTATGLVPALGLHHASVTNAFNLADDLIEPFRPFVDQTVLELIGRGACERESQLTIENRRELARIPFRNVAVAGDITSLLSSAEICVNSLVRAFRKSDASRLSLPEFPQGFTA